MKDQLLHTRPYIIFSNRCLLETEIYHCGVSIALSCATSKPWKVEFNPVATKRFFDATTIAMICAAESIKKVF